MYLVLLSLCRKNLPLLSLYPGILDSYQEFRTKVEELESLIRQKILIITGLSDNKLQTRTHLADLTELMACAIHAFAAKNKDFDLMAKSTISAPQIIDTRDGLAVPMCENIADLAEAYLSDIADWGIDENMVLSLKTAIELFSEKCPQPTVAIKHRATLTLFIKEKVKEIDFCRRHQLDKSVKRLKLTEKTFVSDYFSESRIINAGIRHPQSLPLAPDSEAVA